MPTIKDALDIIGKLTVAEQESLKTMLLSPAFVKSLNIEDFVAKERFANGRVCPLCGCIHVVRNGHRKDGTQRYVCKDCGKSFVIATNSIVSGTRKDLSVWEQYIDCMMNGLGLMLDFVDDENTKYNVDVLKKFIDNKNDFGFIAKINNKIVGFAFGYILLKPDGRKVFYLDAIDVMPDYQGKGYGTGLISFARDYAKTIDCYKMYLITNRSNISACKCYEKAGGINKVDDEIIYVYDFKEKN